MHVSCWSPCARLWRIAFANNMSHWDHACLESLCKIVENCSLELGGGAWGKILKWQTQFFAVVIVACIAHMCLAKKVLFGAGGLGGKCIDTLNFLLFHSLQAATNQAKMSDVDHAWSPCARLWRIAFASNVPLFGTMHLWSPCAKLHVVHAL